MCENSDSPHDDISATALDPDTGYIWIFDLVSQVCNLTIKYYTPSEDKIIVNEQSSQALRQRIPFNDSYKPCENSNNAAISNGIFFYVAHDANVGSINLNSNDNFNYSRQILDYDDYDTACAVLDIKRNFYYLIGEDYSFIVYNIINKNWVEHEGVLGFDYDEPACVIANNHQYLYVIGGRTQAIERLDLNVYHGDSTRYMTLISIFYFWSTSVGRMSQ